MTNPDNYPLFQKFAKSVGVEKIVKDITPKAPWVCFSQEYGVSDLPAAGGLGYLAGDWMLLSGKLGIPFCGIGLYYRTRWKQDIDSSFMQIEHSHFTPHPSHFKFHKLKENGKFASYPFETHIYPIDIEIFVKYIKGNPLIMLYESGIKSLYHGNTQDEHRLYQAAVLGFGGVYALSKLGLTPPILHLNESQTAIAAIALLDFYCCHGLKFTQALEKVREKTIFTNHTLSPAAEAVWTKKQLSLYIGKNLKCKEIKSWFLALIESYRTGISFSDFAFLLSDKVNAVSRLHSIEAGKAYRRMGRFL